MKRTELDPKYLWRLDHIFADDAAWEAAYAAVDAAAADFARLEGHVKEDPRAVIRAYFALMEQLMPVSEYAFLMKEADNGSATAQALCDRVAALEVRAESAMAFVDPELLELPDAELAAIEADPAMQDYSSFIRGLRLQKPHMLTKDQEKLLALLGEVTSAPDNIYSMLTNVNMKFPPVQMQDGGTRPLTPATYASFRLSPVRSERESAFTNFFSTIQSFADTIAATYAASVKNDVAQAKARRFTSARAAAMDPLEIPEAVYDNLIAVMHESLPTLQRYLKLRKEKLGLTDLHMYDLYVPMLQDFDMKLPYEEAFDLMLKGLAPMGEDYIAKLIEARNGGWIDVFPAENKSSGAFSAGNLAKVHPFVLLNHQDNLDSAFTIAHELGHSMHSYYSNTHQPFPKQDYSLFVAEVASTCNEAVMMRTLLNTMTDPKAKAYLLNHFLEQFRTTCFRQTMFAEFEMLTHRMVEEGQPLTKETMSEAYLKLNETYYGESCVVDPLIANEWMQIPHFYRAFYVYVYATGLCAAISLSERILTEGEPAIRDYRKFLSAGSSVPPIEALKLAGIDMSSPEPLRKAMKVFAETLDQLTEVLDQ